VIEVARIWVRQRSPQASYLDVDIVQAADSLSLLETMGRPVAGWVLERRATAEQARARIEHAAARIRLARGRKIASTMLPAAMREFEEELAGARA
jgi:hypothetical protein